MGANRRETGNDFYIYALFRPWDGSPCYIGKGHGRRWKRFSKKRNVHLWNIILKAGGEVLSIKIRTGLAEDEAFGIERALIKAIGRASVGGPLVNMTDGGDGVSGLIVSSETRAKMSEAGKIKIFTEEHKANLRVKNSDETRLKKSIVARNRTYSEETRVKLSVAARNRTYSEETRAKMRVAKTNRVVSEDTKYRMSAVQKVRRAQERWQRAGERQCLPIYGSGYCGCSPSCLEFGV